MKTLLYLTVLFLFPLIVIGCCNKKQINNTSVDKTPLSIIFDTDMGNDIDDALALDMLLKTDR